MPDFSPYCRCPGCGECDAHRLQPKLKARLAKAEATIRDWTVRDNQYTVLAARLAEAEALLREARTYMTEDDHGDAMRYRIDAFLATGK